MPDQIREITPEDFGGIVRRHQAQVFAILHRYEWDFHKVEDLAQETFLKAWRFRERFDGRAPFHHWLAKIALRVALDHLRRQKRVRAEVALADLGEETLDWLHNPGEERELATQQAAELLALAMRELSPEDRQVLTLLELENRSVKEVCRLMDTSNMAVRVRAYRARARLRKVLERMAGENYEK